LLSGASDPFNLITSHPDNITHSKELKSLYICGLGGGGSDKIFIKNFHEYSKKINISRGIQSRGQRLYLGIDYKQ
jgi:hypothetical protein